MAKLNGVFSPTDSIKGFIPQIKMNKKQMLNRMYEIQNQYNNDVKEFQGDKEFIELVSKLGKYKPKILSANKIIEEVN